MTPGVTNSKADGGVGAASANEKILQIVGPASAGPFDQPTSITRRTDLTDIFGAQGVLVEAGAYMIDRGIPVICTRSAATTTGSYGAITQVGAGTSVVAGTGNPHDTYDVKVEILAGSTVGTAGTVYRYSRDGGRTWSAPQQLGTANTLAIPGGITFSLGVGTLLTGQSWSVTTAAPKSTTADLVSALDAVYAYQGSWLRALVLAEADATVGAQLDTFAKRFWPQGKNPEVIGNTRPRNLATSESRATYQTALGVIAAGVQSTEVSLCADQAEMLSSLSGLRLRKPVSIAVAARTMLIDDSEDAAAPADGALPGWFLSNEEGQSLYHDEMLFPGLDTLGFTTLRSFRSRAGAYVNNARVMAGAASDYRYFQLSAIVNRVIEATFPLLENKLSKGVLLAPGGTIREDVAKAIEEVVNAELRTRFVDTRRVSDLRLILSRTDNVQTTDTITFSTPVQPLGYPKFFKGKTGLVRAVPVAA